MASNENYVVSLIKIANIINVNQIFKVIMAESSMHMAWLQ